VEVVAVAHLLLGVTRREEVLSLGTAAVAVAVRRRLQLTVAVR